MRQSLPPLAAAMLLALGMVASAQADAPKATPMPPPEAPRQTIYSFAGENPDCAEWTNACQTCTRDDKGAPVCSTPGIACTPGQIVCRAQKPKTAP